MSSAPKRLVPSCMARQMTQMVGAPAGVDETRGSTSTTSIMALCREAVGLGGTGRGQTVWVSL